MEANCTLNDKFENQHNLQQISVSEAYETLGVYLAMDGNQKKHMESLREKAGKFREKSNIYI